MEPATAVKSLSRDAVVLLRMATKSAIDRLKDGSLRRLDQSHLLAMQALATIEGEA